ncbi:hypothetical protein ASE03_12050 [Kitasatospora sp. Root187]|uniref:AAA family ATPase n=1 Tax=Kitasatospora sp. Root187 TaxID=1736486 RepID=UPI00070B268E|nr:AAA family ATPase [Kitasatospora sp. Root187]KRB61051.1 hypothetical protein ASE03_12050 [Kitasatospora sp. Root187]
MTGSRPRITADMVDERLSQLLPEEARALTTAEHAYRAAAAVLAGFDPTAIRPVDLDPDPAVRDSLADISEPAIGEGGRPELRLRDSDRREAIASLGGPAAVRKALAANPDHPQGSVQDALTGYLTGSALPLAQQSLTELLATARVVDWIDGVIPDLPSQEEVKGHIERKQLLAPLARLVGEHFGGRDAILNELADHVRGTAATVPLLLWGPGGVGKSTVLAKFILDCAGEHATERLPFIFIDLDHPGMLAQEPLSLLLEAVRQLRIEFPGLGPAEERFRSGWIRRVQAPDFDRLGYAVLEPSVGSRTTPDNITASSTLLTAPAERARLYRDFTRFLAHNLPHRPVLLVIDTFETAQRQGPEALAELWRMFEQLARRSPLLRVVLSGRAEVDQLTRSVQVPPFDREAARGYLTALLTPDIAPDPADIDALIDLVGGNPLSLRLAADLLGSGGRADLADIRVEATQARVAGDQVQGWLYRRVLDHIEDHDVRKLASPGLVMRRITSGVIRHVLAACCGVDVPDDSRADELFDLCGQEVSLLARAPDGALEHRSDVRRQLLPLLRHSELPKVLAIHRAAVQYYCGQAGLVDRAEELYHRMSLGDSMAALDARWVPGVEALLIRSLDELPPAGQAYLAARSGVTLAPAKLRQVPLAEWGRHAEVQVAKLLSLGDAIGAATVLTAHPSGSASSRLLLLESRVRAELGDDGKARALVALSRHRAAEEGDGETLLEATYAQAVSAMELGEARQARRLLMEAARLATPQDEPLMPLRIELARCQLARQTHSSTSARRAVREAREMLAELIDDRRVEAVSRDPALLLSLTAAVGDLRPELVWQTLRVIGLQELSTGQRSRLAGALERWEGPRTTPARGIEPRRMGEEVARSGSWKRWLADTSPALLASSLTALSATGGSAAIAAVLRLIYQQWLDARASRDRTNRPG